MKSLSDKIMDFDRGKTMPSYNVIHEEDVRKFIKDLKKELSPLKVGIKCEAYNRLIIIINKLAGDKLI